MSEIVTLQFSESQQVFHIDYKLNSKGAGDWTHLHFLPEKMAMEFTENLKDKTYSLFEIEGLLNNWLLNQVGKNPNTWLPIRYCHLGSDNGKIKYWSLVDICNHLKHRMAIPANSNAEYKFLKKAFNKAIKLQMSFNQPLAVKPFDYFFDWVCFSHFLSCITEAQKRKVRETELLRLIDSNNFFETMTDESLVPLHQILVEVELVQNALT